VRKTENDRLVLMTIVSAVLSFAPLSASADTLRQTMINAYNNSGLLQQNRALLRAADEDVAVAAASLRSVLSWSAEAKSTGADSRTTSNLGALKSDTTTNVANLGITASITLFDGGQNQFALSAAKEAVLSTRQSLLSVEQRVLFSSVEAYMNVRRAGKTVTLRENNLRVIQEELRAAKDRFDVGEVTKTDVALAEARLAASISALAAAKGSLAQQREIFKQAVGKAAGTITTPRSLPKLPKSAKAVKVAAVRNHPEIIAIQHDIKQAEYNVQRASGTLKPTVGLSSTLGYTEMEGDDYRQSGSISLSASSTIYSGGRIPALIRKAMAQRDAQRSGLHLTRLRLEQQAGSAFALLQMAQAGRKASEEQIRASRVAFEGIREEATVGSRTTLDVLNAEQELLDAQAGLISSETDEYIAAYRVLAQMGELTVDALNLPVQKYDPIEYYNLVKTAPSVLSQRGSKLDRILKALSK
jgi:outer membrane protein